jgi:hypothetical protein
MLITFSSPAYANITMFSDVAFHMLRLMGRNQNVPGALLAEDIPQALQQLQAGLEQSPEPEQSFVEEDEGDAVSLSNRALPLIELLKASLADEASVMWREGS